MISIIDYGSDNVKLLASAIEELGYKFNITSREGVICSSDKIIFPGSGEAEFAVRRLHMLNLFSLLRIVKRPFLGTSLGMELLADHSGDAKISYLGIFPGVVEKFSNVHSGWSEINILKETPMLAGIKDKEKFYFDNSFYIPVDEFSTSSAGNEIAFAASIEKNNFYGVQFTPEKSGKQGLHVLKNFIEM